MRGVGFRAGGIGLGAFGLEFWSLGFAVWDLVCIFCGSGFRVLGLVFRAQDKGLVIGIGTA